MVLNRVQLMGIDVPVDIRIDNGKITSVQKTDVAIEPDKMQLSLGNAFAFPGLINSHDHLDFNLFPQLGDKIYDNYTKWGNFIHANYKKEILKVLKVPLLLREQWGVIKNLICGVTTVVNHGDKTIIQNPLITIHEQYHCLHSVKFEKKWKFKLNNPLKSKWPVIIHTGEGTDKQAHAEIDQLIKWNLFSKKLIGIHGVSMDQDQAKNFKALVWCPQSNYFLLNKTAAIGKLKNDTKILFGTDSTLTSDWDIWDHIRLARKTALLSDAELYKILNTNAADIWKLNNGEITAGKDADLFLVKVKENKTALETFFSTSPKDILLIIHQGNIRLFDETLIDQLKSIDLSAFGKINIDGAWKYVQGGITELMENIKEYYPEASFPIC